MLTGTWCWVFRMNAECTCGAVPPAICQARRKDRLVVVLLAVLAGLLMMLGVLGWWLLAGMESGYRSVVEQTGASLNGVQDIEMHASMGYGDLLELRQTTDPQKRAELLRAMAQERAANDRVYDELKRRLTDPDLRIALEDVVDKRLACRKVAAPFMAPTGEAAANTPDASESLKLLYGFAEYQKSCDRLTDRIQAASLRACDETARGVERMRWLFLGVGVLPFAAALILLSAILLLVRLMPISRESG
jgi:hypothetical protein